MSAPSIFAAAMNAAVLLGRLANGPGARLSVASHHSDPAGGPTDTIGRVVAEHMQASLAQPIIIENVGGADSNNGTARSR
jgi:tripartite-type tricarboxylate transporter receptor subunit TctC